MFGGRVGYLSLTISQEVEIETGVSSRCPAFHPLTLIPRHLDLLDTTGENREVWGMVVPVCSAESVYFRPSLRLETCLKKDRPFFVSVLVFVWARHSCRAANWGAVPVTVLWT